MRILPVLAVALIAAGVCASSCSEDKRTYVPNIAEGDTTPTGITTDVRTYISDSGFTRYYIEADLWEMYDDATDPFWLFPRGAYLEQYDKDMHVVSTGVCDTARYLTQQRLWRLRGNVVIVNTQQDSILTQVLYWDQNRHEVYTDSFVHIVRENRIIEGYGFRSNEHVTDYTILKPTGIIPKTDITSGQEPRNTDSVEMLRPNRRAAPPPLQTDEHTPAGANAFTF